MSKGSTMIPMRQILIQFVRNIMKKHIKARDSGIELQFICSVWRFGAAGADPTGVGVFVGRTPPYHDKTPTLICNENDKKINNQV